MTETGKATRSSTGDAGLDALLAGGLPRDRATLAVGGPGAGKTILALQTLAAGLRDGEPAVFVALEEDPRRVLDHTAGFGWDLAEHEAAGRLAFVDARLPADLVHTGDFDLTGTLAADAAQADAIGARRIVIDGIDVLLTFLGDARAERRELARLHQWTQASGRTTLLTVRALPRPEVVSEPHGALLFLADCVLSLDLTVRDGLALRRFRVVKYRGAAAATHEIPFVIGERGLQVAYDDPRALVVDASDERVGAGDPDLDEMLGGGYFRGSSVLVSGVPGTAKTTLAGAFLAAALARGERALFFSFDEPAAQIVRNLRSVGIDLAGPLEEGRLRIETARSGNANAHEHYLHLQTVLEAHAPRCLVLDPITALLHAGGSEEATAIATRLLHGAKARGITTLSTALEHEAGEAEPRMTAVRVSTLADAWLRLTYHIQGGERNRGIHREVPRHRPLAPGP